MDGILTSPWVTAVVLFAAFGCGAAACYRTRQYDTLRARAILAFTLTVFMVLAVYVVRIDPYPVPQVLRRLYAGSAAFLLLGGIIAFAFGTRRARRRLSLRQVYSLLPSSVRELTSEQLRELLPSRFHAHRAHEAYALVMTELSQMPPATLRTLSPEKLRLALQHRIPRSILDQR